MSTKRDPGQFDCYAKLADDEPYFVLRAKDPMAPALIRHWAELRRVQYGEYPKLLEARDCALQMEAWKRDHPEAKPSTPPKPAFADADLTPNHVKYPPPHARYLVSRSGHRFVATPCYGMHNPWWVCAVAAGTGEVDPVPMEEHDLWIPLDPPRGDQ